ncbi:MAG: hypothetical protein CMB80_33310, partial [Flammeovirgaceae bacterium]|nr:hypothetical protein [Flammeovirgaceae bacterium]
MVTPRLPTVTQTWQLDVNNAAARDINQTDNNRKTMFAIKNALVSFSSNPWTVNSSSDGASAGASDLWIDSDDLIWSTGNHSWIVLTKPTTGSQILISCDRSGTNDILMSWSPGGLYTGGTISVDPTATDQVTIQISGTWNGNLSTYYSWVHVWHSSDGRRTRVVVANDAGHPRLFWILDEVDPIPDNWATTPEVVCIFEHGTNALSWFSTLDDVPTFNNVAKSWDDTNEFDIGLFTLGFDSCPSGFGGTNFMSRQEFGSTGNKLNDDEPYPMAPVGIFSRETGFRGAHGILADMYVGHEDRAGATYPDSTTEKLWAQFGDIILPWTGGDAIPISDPTVTETIIDESTNSNDGTPTNMENSDFVLDTAGGSFSTKSTLLGGSEYVVIGDVSPLQFERTDPFSISIWIKTSTVSTRIPISKLDATAPNAGYEIFLLSTGEI